MTVAARAGVLLSGARPAGPPHRGPCPCSDRTSWLRSNWPACPEPRSRRAASGTATRAAAAAAASAAAADPCHFAVLGLPRSATREQVKQAYRRLARQWHPDVNTSPGAAERFKVGTQASRKAPASCPACRVIWSSCLAVLGTQLSSTAPPTPRS